MYMYTISKNISLQMNKKNHAIVVKIALLKMLCMITSVAVFYERPAVEFAFLLYVIYVLILASLVFI